MKLKLILGRINYYANDEISIYWVIQTLIKNGGNNINDLKNIKTISFLSQEFGYIGYSKLYNWQNKKKFEEAVNKEIERMKKNGEIENIIKKYTEN